MPLTSAQGAEILPPHAHLQREIARLICQLSSMNGAIVGEW